MKSEKRNIPYNHNELHNTGPQRTFTGKSLTEIAFPLGGIGTGTISLGGRGNLRDFEIYNKPNKGNVIPFTFFALWAKSEGQSPVAKILEGQIPPPYRNGFGEPQTELQGVSRFKDASFRGEYPKATVDLSDPDMPVRASLTAWNPFIPLNVLDSALPAAIFEWTFRNDSDSPVEISLAASTSNPLTAKNEQGQYTNGGTVNSYQAMGKLKGIVMSHPQADPSDPATGSLALTTTWDDIDVQTRWYRGGGWWDKCHLFWDTFSETGKLTPVIDSEPAPWTGDVGSLVLHASIPAHGSVTMPVCYTWHFPKMINPWGSVTPEELAKDLTKPDAVLDTYVSAHFPDAWSVADYISKQLDRLRVETDLWHDTIFSSTLPDHVLEAITTQASIMRSPTCLLMADGRFFAWEGCGDKGGCCFGSCTHVWNYEQAVAFLFPQLERTMRQTEFLHNTRDTGNMGFRTYLPPGSNIINFKPCADGQMGTVMQVYRDWKLSGDDEFLKQIWPKVKLALEYAWTMSIDKMAPPTPETGNRSIDSLWDPDKDGVMEGEQHNTYDIEFFGPNTMCTAMYLGALKACEEIATYLGETDKADEYHAIYESGRAKTDTDLWNGEYYIQKVQLIDGVIVPDHLKSPEGVDCGPTCQCKKSPGGKTASLAEGEVIPKYQYGEGCLSDQLLGQLNAHVAGLGYLLDQGNVKKAVKSIFENNFRAPIGGFDNVQRVYALNDEAGLLLCSWPHGNRPVLPFVYSDEVWTGIEYHVAAHLIYEGWIDEGLSVVKAVTDRYAGYNRNPWNEVECGHHYARAMSSWAVKLALDGFTYDLVNGRLGFAPKINSDDYRCFWSTGTGWGRYSQVPRDGKFQLDLLFGEQKINRLEIADLVSGNVSVQISGNPVDVKVEDNALIFDQPIVLHAGESLIIDAG
ncbi:MAG: GH116 family glycosyl-hydrolase [Armatimonadota bacterium]